MQEVNSLCTDSGPLRANTVLCHATQYSLLVTGIFYRFLPVKTAEIKWIFTGKFTASFIQEKPLTSITVSYVTVSRTH